MKFYKGQRVRCIDAYVGNPTGNPTGHPAGHLVQGALYTVAEDGRDGINVLVTDQAGKTVNWLARRFVLAAPTAPTQADTGGTKKDDGKNQLALLPFEALEAVGRVMTFGATKYAANNWRAGFKWTRVISAALRHTFAWMKGEDLDPESGESHLAHAACCILFVLTFVLTKTGEDDRYKGAANG